MKILLILYYTVIHILVYIIYYISMLICTRCVVKVVNHINVGVYLCIGWLSYDNL